MVARKSPAGRCGELTTESAVKLRPVRHFLEPTDREIEATVDDEQPLTEWSSDATLRAWCEFRPHLGADYLAALEDTGKVEVGTLRGTPRTVYATFRTRVEGSRRMRDVVINANGGWDIQLVAGPFDHCVHPLVEPVAEAQLTDQHGLAGFCATAEVLDWSIVEFAAGVRGGRLHRTYTMVTWALSNTELWLE